MSHKFLLQITHLPLLTVSRYGVHEMDYYLARIVKLIMFYGPRSIVGLAAFWIGLWLIRKLCNALARLMMIRRVDTSLIPFLKTVISITLRIFLVLSILSFIGFNTTSFLTALGAAGLAVGLALQGSLSNFAGGVLILLFKPFRTGDVIEAQGHRGTVKEIQVLYTIIMTADNKKVVIPNGSLSNKDITNFTGEANRRLDLKISISYSSDLKKALAILNYIAKSHPIALQEPAAIVGVHDLGEKTVNLDFQVWVKRIDLANAQYGMNEQIKYAFEEAGISFLGPAQDIIVQNTLSKEE